MYLAEEHTIIGLVNIKKCILTIKGGIDFI